MIRPAHPPYRPLTRFEQTVFAATLRGLTTRLRVVKNTSDAPLTEYADDFAGYCRDIIGVEPWAKQIEIANSVRDYQRTAVASSHASGKSWCAAAIANWWLDTRDPAVVMTTAPSYRQVRRVIWREIRKIRARALRKLPGELLQVEVKISDQRFAMGFSSDDPNAVQGLREAKNVLIIEDESPGIDEGVVESLETILTDPSSRHLKQGNPTVMTGHFHAAFHEEAERWNCLHISAFDTPNLKAGRIVVPGLVTQEWVDDRRAKWGESSPLWRMRVLGEFSEATGQKVIPPEWVRAACQRWTPPETLYGGTMAVDVASTGQDRSVITLLVGRRMMELEAFHEADLMATARRVVEAVIRYKPANLHVDATGLGLGCFHRLEQIQKEPGSPLRGVKVKGIVLGSASTEKTTFPRLMDELMWRMRLQLDPNGEAPIAINPQDVDLCEQLSLRGWSLDEKSRIKVESKNELRRRGAHSPDSADSCMLAFEAPQVYVTWSGRRKT